MGSMKPIGIGGLPCLTEVVFDNGIGGNMVPASGGDQRNFGPFIMCFCQTVWSKFTAFPGRTNHEVTPSRQRKIKDPRACEERFRLEIFNDP